MCSASAAPGRVVGERQAGCVAHERSAACHRKVEPDGVEAGGPQPGEVLAPPAADVDHRAVAGSQLGDHRGHEVVARLLPLVEARAGVERRPVPVLLPQASPDRSVQVTPVHGRGQNRRSSRLSMPRSSS